MIEAVIEARERRVIRIRQAFGLAELLSLEEVADSAPSGTLVLVELSSPCDVDAGALRGLRLLIAREAPRGREILVKGLTLADAWLFGRRRER